MRGRGEGIVRLRGAGSFLAEVRQGSDCLRKREGDKRCKREGTRH